MTGREFDELLGARTRSRPDRLIGWVVIGQQEKIVATGYCVE
ncbi:MAG: hypothetical protein P8049_09525 [Gemmatimonadota bacterium]